VGQRGLGQRLLTLAAVAVVVGGVLALLAAVGIFGGGNGGVEAARLVETPRPTGQLANLAVEASKGSLAPDFEFSDFDGNRHRLSDYRGHPVYLNIWATWCAPCREELPDMQELQDRHSEGERLVVIALNRAESLDQARSFLESIQRGDGGRGVTFTVDGLDPTDQVFPAYRGLGMPTSVFIDEDGVVRFTWTGLLRLTDMEAALQETVGAAQS
jgi:thiol-disulfide isomerase/thioredoxin